MAEMRTQNWFKDIKSSSEGGFSQAKLEVNRVKAESYGLNVTDLTSALAMYVQGVDPIEVTERTESLDVKIRLEEQYRNSLDKIMELEIKTGDNKFIRVGDIATIVQEEGPSAIETKNGDRVVTVGANLDSSKGTNDAANFIQEAYKKAHPA